MNGSHDCYVLAPERSADMSLRFLDEFLPDRDLSCAPEDPAEVLGLVADMNLNQILEHLQLGANIDYSMYFRSNTDSDPSHAAVLFQSDGSLFFMLSVEPVPEVADRFLENLKRFSATKIGYWGWEESPVIGAESFRQRAAVHGW